MQKIFFCFLFLFFWMTFFVVFFWQKLEQSKIILFRLLYLYILLNFLPLSISIFKWFWSSLSFLQFFFFFLKRKDCNDCSNRSSDSILNGNNYLHFFFITFIYIKNTCYFFFLLYEVKLRRERYEQMWQSTQKCHPSSTSKILVSVG